MSADNVIYIKKKEDRWLVWHQCNPEFTNPQGLTLKEFPDKLKACDYAFKLQKDYQTEYGVQLLNNDSSISAFIKELQ